MFFCSSLLHCTRDTPGFVSSGATLDPSDPSGPPFLLSALRTRQWLRWRLLLCQLINTCRLAEFQLQLSQHGNKNGGTFPSFIGHTNVY